MTIEIPAEIESQIDAAAKRAGESKGNLVREAILRYIEDLDDMAAAQEYLANPHDTISLAELKENLGLDN